MNTIDIDTFQLDRGKHDTLSEGACAMELVSYIAGEPFSDHPECVCPVLGAFTRAWNDSLDGDTRNRLLKPFIPRLIGTRSTADVEDARAFMAADWAVRTYTPVWLRAAGLDDIAARVEALPVLSSTELCMAAMPLIREARERAAAAWAAAGDAARAAARAAAADAAARAAAADAAARAAAGDAARAAARAAAGDALRPHVELLQTSAVDLYDRMIKVGQP